MPTLSAIVITRNEAGNIAAENLAQTEGEKRREFEIFAMREDVPERVCAFVVKFCRVGRSAHA